MESAFTCNPELTEVNTQFSFFLSFYPTSMPTCTSMKAQNGPARRLCPIFRMTFLFSFKVIFANSNMVWYFKYCLNCVTQLTLTKKFVDRRLRFSLQKHGCENMTNSARVSLIGLGQVIQMQPLQKKSQNLHAILCYRFVTEVIQMQPSQKNLSVKLAKKIENLSVKLAKNGRENILSVKVGVHRLNWANSDLLFVYFKRFKHKINGIRTHDLSDLNRIS